MGAGEWVTVPTRLRDAASQAGTPGGHVASELQIRKAIKGSLKSSPCNCGLKSPAGQAGEGA